MELTPPEYVDSEEGLEALARSLRDVDALAVDTEADSFHHYREKVCLIQLTFHDRDVLVDPLALPNLDPLKAAMANSNCIKIFHDAGYDFIGLFRDFSIRCDGLFDTMLACRLLGLQNFGLASLLSERFDFELDKRFQRSDWAKRPLSPEQINYARLDTHFLHRLAAELRDELEAAGRWAWAQEDFSRVPESALKLAGRSTKKDALAWWRVRGVKTCKPVVRGRVRALYDARDRIAQQLDRPPFKVFGDSVLVDLARNPPKSLKKFAPRRGLRKSGIDRFGEEILQAIAKAEPVPGSPPPGSGRRKRHGRFLEPDARARYEELRALRKKKAAELKIDPDVLLPNATLETIAKKPPVKGRLATIAPLDGWRGEFLLSELNVLLNNT